ncbi:MAG: hypothetical protein H7330_08680 [Hymenobacteraceae bacterium]|nr:hypothetical protein [Hymenobacteraceae bacterium]
MSVLPVSTTVLVVAPPTLQRQGLIATLVTARPDLSLQPLADAHALPAALRSTGYALVILDATVAGPPLSCSATSAPPGRASASSCSGGAACRSAPPAWSWSRAPAPCCPATPPPRA